MTAVTGLPCCTVRPTSPLAWALASQTGDFQLVPLGVVANEKPHRGQFSVCSPGRRAFIWLRCAWSHGEHASAAKSEMKEGGRHPHPSASKHRTLEV